MLYSSIEGSIRGHAEGDWSETEKGDVGGVK